MAMVVGAFQQNATREDIAKLQVNIDRCEGVGQEFFRSCLYLIHNVAQWLGFGFAGTEKKRPAPVIGAGLRNFFNEKLKHSFAPIDLRLMPPPCYVCQFDHSVYASVFFRATLLVLAGASADAGSAVLFRDAVLFSFAFMALRLLELPKDPIAILPFLDFLSPFPMYSRNFTGQL